MTFEMGLKQTFTTTLISYLDSLTSNLKDGYKYKYLCSGNQNRKWKKNL